MLSRAFLVLAAGVGLSACQPAIPDSGLGVPDPGRGVGFDNSAAAQQRVAREAAQIPAAAPVTAQPLGQTADGSAEATAAETRRVLAATSSGAAPVQTASVGNNGVGVNGGLGNDASTNSGVEPLAASPSNAPPPLVDGGGISRENNFDAVSAQRGIEGDAARLAANRAQYTVVQPEALPSRSSAGPNIVAYALANRHPVGTRIYNRVGFNKQAKFERICGKFASSDEAQIAFLEAGGPRRDRNGMDPDGDGYACNWNPAPFRIGTSG
ncbi:MAG: hypothetical protein AAF744_12360 [Pseudomonadota bacterium]